jgi:hypothetical protein
VPKLKLAEKRARGGSVISTEPYRLKAFNLTVDALSSAIQNYKQGTFREAALLSLENSYVVKGVSVLSIYLTWRI